MANKHSSAAAKVARSRADNARPDRLQGHASAQRYISSAVSRPVPHHRSSGRSSANGPAIKRARFLACCPMP